MRGRRASVEAPEIVVGRPCKRGHTSGRRYASDRSCVECAVERAQARYAVRADAIKQYAKRRYDADPETARRVVRARRSRDPDKVKAEKRAEYGRHRGSYIERARNRAADKPDAVASAQRKWRESNPDRVAVHAAQSAASRRRRLPRWLSKDHKQEIASFYIKARRLTRATGIQYTVDHIVPLRGAKVSGLHVPWNLQILTHHENCAKSNRFVPAQALAQV